MKVKLVIALYLGVLGLVTYAWWPNIYKLGFVDGDDIYGGWGALWQMFPLLALVTFTVGLALTTALLVIAAWAEDADTTKTEAKHRAREQAIEKRGEELMRDAREQVAGVMREVAYHKRAAEQAIADERAAKARAKTTREESEQAHRNVREQLKRLKKTNARLNGY